MSFEWDVATPAEREAWQRSMSAKTDRKGIILVHDDGRREELSFKDYRERFGNEWYTPLEDSSKFEFRAGTKRRVMLKEYPYCAYCGCGLDGQSSTIDHVIPKSKHKYRNRLAVQPPRNLVLACFGCNNAKGDSLQVPVHVSPAFVKSGAHALLVSTIREIQEMERGVSLVAEPGPVPREQRIAEDTEVGRLLSGETKFTTYSEERDALVKVRAALQDRVARMGKRSTTRPVIVRQLKKLDERLQEIKPLARDERVRLAQEENRKVVREDGFVNYGPVALEILMELRRIRELLEARSE